MRLAFRSAAALFAALVAVSPASAQTYTWNAAVNSNWDTATANWSGAGSTWVNGTGNTARFTATGAGTVTLQSTITTGILQFTANGYTIAGSGRTLNLSTFDVANNVSATVASQTVGTSVSKSGGGTLTLTNSFNSYSSGVTINSGILAVGTTGALASSGTVTLNGGTLSTAPGFSTNAGPLKVNSLSDITLGNTVHNIQFTSLDTSSGFGGLTINNWAGTPGNSGTQGQVRFADPSAFTASVLSNITFNLAGGGSVTGATFVNGTELVPVPVPEPAAILGVAAAALAYFRRRPLAASIA